MAANPISQPSQWTFRRVVWATLVVASVFFCFWLLYRFYNVFFTLFIAIVMGTVIRPAANWLSQKGIPRMAAVILIYLVFLILLGGFVWLLFPLLFEQGATIAREMPVYYQNFRNSLLHSPNSFVSRLGQVLPLLLPGFAPAPPVAQNVAASMEQIWQYVGGIAHVLFTTIVILTLTLYWTLDGPRITKSSLLLVPQDQREGISDLIAAMESKVGFYIIGQGILCLVIAIMALIAYTLIGLPNALVLALAAGVLEAVPMAGPVLGAVPAAIVAISISPSRLVWVVVATIVVQQLENNLLVPRVMKKTVGVNPFVTLLSIFAFGSLFGIAGALMAIPLAAIVQLTLNHFVFKESTVELEPAEGRNYASRLRYEAQELIKDLRKQSRNKKRGTDEKIVQIEQVMDEIESIAANLDALLAQANSSDEE
jgi:predicted PurR-regulated permease PerM